MSRRRREAADGGGRDTEPKTRTPHKDVGNNADSGGSSRGCSVRGGGGGSGGGSGVMVVVVVVVIIVAIAAAAAVVVVAVRI